MASELTLNCTVLYDDGVTVVSDQVTDRVADVATTLKPLQTVQLIGITEEAITLPEGGSPGMVMLRNLDPTNFISVRVATSGAKFAKLRPDTNSDGKGGFCCLELDSGAQAPYAIADTAASRMKITIFPAAS